MSNGAREFIESQAGQHLVNTLAHHLGEDRKRIQLGIHLAFLSEDHNRGIVKLQADDPRHKDEVFSMSGQLGLTEMAQQFAERTGATHLDSLSEMCARYKDIEPNTWDEALACVEARDGLSGDDCVAKARRLYPRLFDAYERQCEGEQMATETRFFREAAASSVANDLDIEAAILRESYHQPELYKFHVEGEPVRLAGPEYNLQDAEEYPHFQKGAERQPSTRPLPDLNAQQQRYWARRARQHVESEFQKLGLNIGTPYFGYDVLEDLVHEALADGFNDRLSADSDLIKRFRQKCPSQHLTELHLALCEAKIFVRREFLREVDVEKEAQRYAS